MESSSAKEAQLNSLKEELKVEFVGIDEVIDEIFDLIGSWYIFPHLQKKPLIVNLWGLTGIGKTSLVEAIVKGLNLDDKYYYVDMSDKNAFDRFKLEVGQDFAVRLETDCVVAIDEIQHARSISAKGDELSDAEKRLWSFIDKGTIDVSRDNLLVGFVEYFFQEIIKGLRTNIRIVDNKIFGDKKEIKNIYDRNGMELLKDSDGDYCFIPPDIIALLFYCFRDLYSSEDDLLKTIKDTSKEDMTQLLRFFINKLKQSRQLNLKKGLFFVLGNIDDAYTMSSDFNRDISADEFYKLSKKIRLADIKNALIKSFRSEQIARLGNNHIIYPAFTEANYKDLIAMKLKSYQTELEALLKVDVVIDSSLHKAIYEDGVFPTQGARPVISTIYKLLESHTSLIYRHYAKLQEKVCQVNLEIKDDLLKMTYIFNNEQHVSFTKKQILNLKKNNPPKDETQDLITAVHEAGHAVICSGLLYKIPQKLSIISSESDTSGFMYLGVDQDIEHFKQVIPRLAMCYGGFTAERLVFGDENQTFGSHSDLKQATRFANKLVKQEAFETFFGVYDAYNFHSQYVLRESMEEVENRVESLLQKGYEKASEFLKIEFRLLIKLAERLMEKETLSAAEIEEVIEEHAISFSLETIKTKGTDLMIKQLFSKAQQKIKQSVVDSTIHQESLVNP